MSNNDNIDNDLDVEDFDDGGFDDYSQKGSLGDVWRNNPMVKIGVILAAVALVIGAIILFGGGSKEKNPSVVASGSSVTEAPGTSELSQTMQDAIQEANDQRTENALRTSGSAIPTPIEPSKDTLPLQMDNSAGEDPLERWRRLQEERIRQQEVIAQTKPSQPEAPKVDTRTPAVNALSQSMISQMQAVLQNQTIPKPQFKPITPVAYLETLEQKKMAKFMQQQQMMANTQGTAGEVIENIFLPAGTIEYGQLLIEANTDAPGPVIAQIVSGPLRGSRVLGSFQSTDRYITLNFSMVVIDGINYPIQAVAIDPDTTLPGMVSEIDHRYFKRIVLPMAAEFVSGLASAVSQSGSTTIYIDGGNAVQSQGSKNSRQEVASGLEAAGDELADILDEEADNTQIMLRVAAGTPLGILFLAPVTDLAQTTQNP